MFPQQKAHDSMEAKIKSEELQDEPTANIAFVPLKRAQHRRAGHHCDDYQPASTVKHGVDFLIGSMAAPPIIRARIILWGRLRSSGQSCDRGKAA